MWSPSLIRAPQTPGCAADGGGLGELPGAERGPAGAAPSTATSFPLPPELRRPRPAPPREVSSPGLRPRCPLQELQGKVMEAVAALDAWRGGPEL